MIAMFKNFIKGKRKLYILMSLVLCLALAISAIISQVVFAVPDTTIPVVEDSLTTDLTKPVVLINGSSQTGYATLAAAMSAIGNNDGDYTIVFVQDYDMVVSTDMNATKANATGDNVSLSITSTFIPESTPGVQQTKTFSMRGSNITQTYNFFFNADTTIHDCVFDVYGACCSHMFGNGNNFTIGENVVVNNKGSNGRIQLYGGSLDAFGTAENPAKTNLVINSGTFAYAFAGNRDGAFFGDAKITVQGNALVNNLHACSQKPNCFSSGSTSKVYVNGADGAVCANIKAGLSTSGLTATDAIDIYLNNVQSQDNSGKNNYGNIDLVSLNPSVSNVYVNGDCQVCTNIAATNLIIDDNSSIRNGNNSDGTKTGAETLFTGILSLSGDLVLGENSKYAHAGTGAQKIDGNIIVNGSDSEIQIFKRSADSTPVKMTIGGAYSNIADTLTLSIWNDVAVMDNDVLLTFLNAANAVGENYNRYASYSGFGFYETKKSGANIIFTLQYPIPPYYVHTSTPDLYSFTEIGNSSNSDGGSHTVYRKYEYNSTLGVWEVFNSDSTGVISGSPVNQNEEHPQPNNEYRSNFESSKGTMIKLDAFGKYRITAAVGTNASGYSANSMGTACGNHIAFYNIDGKGTNSSNTGNTYESNASWADLKKTDSNCGIYKAYLVMTTPLRGNSGEQEEQLKSNLINNPMKLMFGSDEMLSNGYLPEGFSIGKTGTNDAALSSDTPTLLYDNNLTLNTYLGEAMTITDVTDFVKAHGYGRYYGVDIPYEGNDVDSSIAWRLIVLEEDVSMKFVRKVSLQIGPINNGNLTDDSGPAAITLDLDGLTTPDPLSIADFGGQLLMIGSDNTTDRRAGGGTGSNLHNTFYPDPDNRPTEAILIASNDPATAVVDRPLGHWSQGLMDIDGVNLTKDQVSHLEESNGAMGIDMSLLSITNHENTDWATTGGHNLYLTPSSPKVKLTSKKDTYGVGYIDVLGISTDVSLPKFDTEIWHTDICTIPTVGIDIVAGQPVIVKGTATNITPTASVVQGSFNTKVIVNIDKKLTGIRDITATFHNHDPGTDTFTDESIVGVYDATHNTISFDFGSTFLDIPLYNTNGDWIEFDFKADTNNTPTIDDPNVQYINNVGVWGQTIYQNNEVIHTPYARYDYDEDRFDTYTNQLRISKTVTGDLSDPNQEFSFTILFSNAEGGHYPEGTKISYTGGVLDGITVENPGNGTLTVNSSGSVTIKLKHGQFINFVGVLENVEISETQIPGYMMSWENVLLGDVETITQNVGHGGTTGNITVGKGESRQIDIYNDKGMIPSVGVNASSYNKVYYLAFILTFLLAVGGFSLILLRKKRKKLIDSNKKPL